MGLKSTCKIQHLEPVFFATDQWQAWEKGERGRINLFITILICSLGSFPKFLSICFQKLNVCMMSGFLLFSLQKPRLLFGVCMSPSAVKRKKEKIYVESCTTHGQSQEKHSMSAILTLEDVKWQRENSDNALDACFFHSAFYFISVSKYLNTFQLGIK